MTNYSGFSSNPSGFRSSPYALYVEIELLENIVKGINNSQTVDKICSNSDDV